MTDIRRDLARNTLAILCIHGLIGLSVWVLLPFLAAGFSGGGVCGKRSLEGTFLPGCVMTARSAARSINAGLGH